MFEGTLTTQVIIFGAFLYSVVLHEVAHGYIAEALGDLLRSHPPALMFLNSHFTSFVPRGMETIVEESRPNTFSSTGSGYQGLAASISHFTIFVARSDPSRQNTLNRQLSSRVG